jgi:dihydroneopterin aldolase
MNMTGIITIELNDLHFFVRQGLYKEEEHIENELVINIQITFDAPENGIEHISQTVNYAAVYQMIKDLLTARQYLLETTAIHICDRIAAQYSFIKEITVSIRKCKPPIVNFTGSVGIRYTKQF